MSWLSHRPPQVACARPFEQRLLDLEVAGFAEGLGHIHDEKVGEQQFG